MSNPPHGLDRDYVLYLRKSKGKAGIERQRRETTRHISRLGGRIVAEFVDVDRTAFAKTGEGRAVRDSYSSMLRVLQEDKGTPPLGVASWHADRLHRNPGEAADFITVASTGHPVETARSGGYDLSTPTGRKRFMHDAVDAAYEVDHLIERIDSAKAEAAAEGRWLGGRRPFGFAADGVTHRPAEVEAIADGYRMLLAGSSLAGIAREWNARGLRTPEMPRAQLCPGGGAWTPTQVRRVLLRARNAGLMAWRGEIVGPAQWEGIVPEATWRAAARILSDPARRTSPGPQRRWLGSGLYLCGVCLLARMRSGRAGRRGGMCTVYRCTEGPHVVREALLVDEYVVGHVVARLSRPDARDLLVDADAPDVEQVEARLLQVRGELAEAERARPSSVREARMLAALADDLAEEAAELEGRLFRPSSAAIFGGLIGVEDVGAAWEALPLDRQRAVVGALFVVTVNRPPRGRPPGWRPGESYFHTDSINVVPVE